ncbi:hypothetical protein JCM3765_004233 [Sporobolomyces pararoseus]
MSTMDTTESITSGKDYFSLLPNEILQDIFDEAIDSLAAVDVAISKRLLPLVQASFYRLLYLDSLESLSCLVRTIHNRPHLGSTTHKVILSFDEPDPDNTCLLDPSQVLFLLSKLPHLRSFSSTHPLIPPRLQSLSSISTLLRSVSIAVATDSGGEIVRLEETGNWLATLTALEELKVTEWHFYDRYQLLFSHRFANVKSLTVSGGGVAQPELSILINSCPQLENLSLYLQNIYEFALDFDDLLSVLTALFNQLKSLSISTSADLVHFGSSLADFTSLKHLSLELPEIYPELHESVLKLINLESLDVSCPDYSLSQVIEMVEGPNRLLRLRSLTFNQVDAWEGYCFDPDSSVDVSSFKEHKYERFEDWDPDYIDWRESDFWSESEALMKAAEVAGVSVEGSILEARQVFLSYLLELNNLAIANAFFHRQFNEIPYARSRADRFGLELPELEFDSLDPEKLELVKVPVPELDRFALTLKDKDNESGLGGRQ